MEPGTGAGKSGVGSVLMKGLGVHVAVIFLLYLLKAVAVTTAGIPYASAVWQV